MIGYDGWKDLVKDTYNDWKTAYTFYKSFGATYKSFGATYTAAHYATNYIIVKMVFLVATHFGYLDSLMDLIPMHDSWSPPQTEDEARLLQLRIEQLKRLADEEHTIN